MCAGTDSENFLGMRNFQGKDTQTMGLRKCRPNPLQVRL